MKRPSEIGSTKAGPVMKVAAGFLMVGLFLFLHAWIPVQAERSHLELKKLEILLSRRKSELDEVNAKYAAMTALPVLDQWAKAHGPWVTPNGENVIPIEE